MKFATRSNIVRRCGQLGVPLNTVLRSVHLRGLKPSTVRIKYKDGRSGTTGWGIRKVPMLDKFTTEHNEEELYMLLETPYQPKNPFVKAPDNR